MSTFYPSDNIKKSPLPEPNEARRTTQSSNSHSEDKDVNPTDVLGVEKGRDHQDENATAWHRSRYTSLILATLAALILGWWISATILGATRHRWWAGKKFTVRNQSDDCFRIVQTVLAWFFILCVVKTFSTNIDHSLSSYSIIAFRFIPNSVVTRPTSAVWQPLIQNPWYRLPKAVRLTVGWVCLLAIVFGSAFGFPIVSQVGGFTRVHK
jgi:CNT family concentrative nucleoside transporter